MSTDDQKRQLALDLHAIGAVKFGEFVYNSGGTGPMYVDLRLLISYPKVLKKIAKLYARQLESIQYDRLCGVAYGALPIAGAVSLEIEKPWIFMRKEGVKKDHGLKKVLEGEYNSGETVVMIEDLAMKATALLQVIPKIKDEGLQVKDAVVLLDYQKGAHENMAAAGYNLHVFITIHELLDILKNESKIDAAKYRQCVDFLAS
jgi:uridine monophosphate synthetase